MILIITDNQDQTTMLTIDWLLSYEEKLIIHNREYCQIYELVIRNNDISFNLIIDDNNVSSSSVRSYWYRRGNINFDNNELLMPLIQKKEIGKLNFIREESRDLSRAIMKEISKKHGLGNFEDNNINKLEVLQTANLYDLIIPETLVTSFRTKLHSTIKENQKSITKAIRNGGYYKNSSFFNFSTHLVESNHISLIPKFFHPTLIQQQLKKKYELRIFYLDGDFYTSAIFSQNDEQTKVDFRNYNDNRPNRTPPYQLPKDIEQKLHKLMQKLTIKCGSIDMVVNTKNEFVFLEINPVGQFQQVSFPCNYYLELKVAEYLTKYDQKEAVC